MLEEMIGQTSKAPYEKPVVEVIEFKLIDHIAGSAMGATNYEQIWGGS